MEHAGATKLLDEDAAAFTRRRAPITDEIPY
jgi:hypothetical protein